MKYTWIDLNNEEQKRWAKDYFQKKRAGLTRSHCGISVVSQWDDAMHPLKFLKDRERYENCEFATSLLKMMKAAWNQQLINKRKKSRSIKISIKSSNQLKALANREGKTQYDVLEGLIFNQYQDWKHHKVKEKEARKRIRQLEDLASELRMAKEEIKTLKNNLKEAEVELTKNNKTINQQEICNLKLSIKLGEIQSRHELN